MFFGTVSDIFHIPGKGRAISVENLDGLPQVGDGFALAGHQCRVAATGKVRTRNSLTLRPLPGNGATIFLIEDCGLSRDDIDFVRQARITTVENTSDEGS